MASVRASPTSSGRFVGGMISSITVLDELGRTRLSRSFILRDFLHSDNAAIHGLANAPDDQALAIAAGTRLCEELLEPLQDRFGCLAIRSAYRSSAVNRLGNEMQAAGRKGYNCATNDRIAPATSGTGATPRAGWARPRASSSRPSGMRSGTKRAAGAGSPGGYTTICPIPRSSSSLWAFNIQWREDPERRIDSYAGPRGCLTKPGMAGHGGRHKAEWAGIERVMRN